MAPQAFVPIHRRPKSELQGPNAPASTASAAPASKAAKPAAKPPAKKAKNGTSAFPVLPALAATLLILGGVQVGLWWWGKASEVRPPLNVAQTTPLVGSGAPRAIGPLSIPVLPQNLQFGDASGQVTVTILSDPSCGTCRVSIRELIGGLPTQGVRYVYKFWPRDPSLATPGLLLELARREGAVAPFWTAIQGSGADDLDDTALLHLLDHSGVALAAQRAALADNTHSLMQALEPDLRAAATANLPAPPVFIINDTLMDTTSLTPTGLNQYVAQLLAKKEVEAPATHSSLRQMMPKR